MRAAAPRRALGLAAALGLPACGAGTFVCGDASDCVGAGVDGVCQEDGFCSFPDDVCPSGQRYGSHSGSLAGECVPTHGGTTSGGTPSTDTTTHTGTSTTDPVTTLPLDASATDDGTTSSPTDPTDASTSAPDSSDEGSTVDPDLLVWLSFEDGALTNDGALGGAASCIDEQCPETMLGVLGDALLLDGVDDCVSFESAPELETMEQLTVAAWIRIDVDAMHYGFVDKPIGDSFNNSWALYYYPARGGSVQLFAMTDGVVGNNLTSADPLVIGDWVHLAGASDGVDMSLWVDGALVSTGTAPDVAFDEQAVLIGCDDDHERGGVDGFFAGAMDDVRVYSRALEPEEIAALADQRSP